MLSLQMIFHPSDLFPSTHLYPSNWPMVWIWNILQTLMVLFFIIFFFFFFFSRQHIPMKVNKTLSPQKTNLQSASLLETLTLQRCKHQGRLFKDSWESYKGKTAYLGTLPTLGKLARGGWKPIFQGFGDILFFRLFSVHRICPCLGNARGIATIILISQNLY